MTLVFPKYVPLARIQGKIIRYLWDDWNVEIAEAPINEALRQRLRSVSQRASVSFAIANAEWLVLRFEGLMVSKDPLWYLETAWAQAVDARYGLEWDPLQSGWNGPVMGPIRQALMWVGDAIEQVEDDLDPAKSAATLARLVEYVLPTIDDYRTWSDQVLTRLETYFPFTQTDPKGDVVPREAMDPAFDFRLESIEHLVNAYLARLDRDVNPFLNSPEGMIEQGFKGTPYVFNIEQDRQARADW